MSLISVNKLSFNYDTSFDYIFKDVSFSIDTDWRLGFVGRNGKGKTTFLNLLMGKYEYGGYISCSVKFDYFPFEVKDADTDALSVVYDAVPEAELWQLIKELNILGVDEECLYKPFKILSGGEKTKIMLAALFCKENNFLLIDEPTNHLDINARKIVAEYLNKKKGFILVSHDRTFLDTCVDHILSINRANIEVQKGNFSSWLYNKEMQDKFELGMNEKLIEEIDKLKTASERTAEWSQKGYSESTKKEGFKEFHRRKAQKLDSAAKNLKSRQVKSLEVKSKLLKNIERVDSLKIMPLKHFSERLIEIRNLSVFYGERKIFSELDTEVSQGDRISVCGVNGCGKSTLLKLIAGEDIGYSGTLNTATGLKISYVPQDSSFLKGNLTDFALDAKIDETLFKAILAKLDFTKLQFAKDMSEFSSGQKKKVLIAKSLCQSAHLYIWDEPLNYIDVISRMQIESLITSFNPTMLFVEHDEAFVNNIATKKILLERE